MTNGKNYIQAIVKCKYRNLRKKLAACSGGIAIDLNKVFDSAPYRALLNKLQNIGINASLHAAINISIAVSLP